MKTFATALLALALFSVPAAAEASDFIGNWNNPDPKATGLMHVAISPNGGNRVDVRAYGDCHPMECDWGLVQGKVYYADPKSTNVVLIIATFHFGFAHHQVTLRKGARGQLQFEMATEFDDNSEHHDFAASGILKPTTWVGPIAPVWQTQPGLQTGWGGGARSGAVPSPEENCVTADTRGVRAVVEGGVWKVKAGGKVLIDAGRDAKSAELMEVAIRHYKFDRRCTVGGPYKTYWRAAGGFASERLGGAWCVGFNPTTVHVVRMKNAWAIIDAAISVMDFGPLKNKADATLGLIRAHRLTAVCSIRMPDPLMSFWVAEPTR